MRHFTKILSTLLFADTLCLSIPVSADGNNVDKVYHPYVSAMEKEVEFRSIYQRDNDPSLNGLQAHRLGLGYSFTEDWFTEIYLVGEKTLTDEFDTNKVEIEAKLQLTEQGEYAADWGLLFEFGRDFENNIGEFTTALLGEKEFGRWVGALNLFLEYESREHLANEFETRLASQIRYRYSRHIEPAIEFYQGQDTTALGPAIMGDIRLGIAKKLHWEAGIMLGLRDSSPDQTFRALVEYEF